jgi:hypothetical protein
MEHKLLHISRITVIEISGGLKAKNATKQLADFEDFIKNHIITNRFPIK